MSIKAKRVLTAVLAVILALALLCAAVLPALADENSSDPYDNSSLEAEKEALEAQAANASALASATQEEINEAQALLDKVNAEINDLDSQLMEVTAQIQTLNGQIEENTDLLEQTEAELAQAKEDLATYYGELKGRIQMMYENDTTSYLEILLASSTISDFFSRWEYISEMVSYDNEIMGKLDDAQKRIETSKARIEETEKKLEADKAEQELKQAELENILTEKQQTYTQLDENKYALILQQQEYEAQQVQLLAQISDVQNQIDSNNEASAAAEAARIAAEEEARRQAEEAAAAAAAASAAAASSSAASDETGTSTDTSSTGGGSYAGYTGFIWPLSYVYITSYYGYRQDPYTGYYGLHDGIDLGSDYGTPIYAAASGTVTMASWYYGYGNAVMINHGNGYVTLYGHMSSFAVSAGEYVSQGQVIGYVGSTGWSTGPHLHFTVIENGAAVDPLAYLP